MTSGTLSRLILAGGLVAALGCAAVRAAGEDKKPATGALVVIDNSGKEHQLKDWKFVAGTRHLSWLAQAADKGKAAGPEALEFTEGKSAPLKRPIVTLVPLEHVRSIEFDNAKETATLRVAKTADSDEVLHGVSGYVGINIVALEAQIELAGIGTATAKFQGGVKRGVRSIRFPSPKPLTALVPGRPAEVVGASKAKDVHRAVDLQALYLFPDGSLRTSPTLFFQKTVKLDLDKVQKMNQVGNGAAKNLVLDVTLKDGQQNPLVLIERMDLAKGKAAFLQGLVGRVEVGYKLFPMQAIAELRFDAQKTATPAPPGK